MAKPKLIRITTVPISLDKLLEGQLKYMTDTYDVTAISSAEDNYLKQVADREDVAYFPIELTRAITPLQDLKSLWLMYRYLKKEKPEIVHSHTPKAGTISMLAAKLADVPIRLHTVAGLPLMEAKGLKRILLNSVEKMTYAAATKVLPNSKGLKQIILEEGFCRENKLEVIGKGSSNGIDTNYFDPALYDEEFKDNLRKSLQINANDFVYIFVGRIVRDKGIVELVQAFKNLNNPKTKLILVGSFEHDLDPLPSATIKEIESNSQIIQTGWQKDVRPYLAISDVLTFPSYREGFPNVVMQAGAMGLPAVVSDINGCNEIIQADQNGIIIPVKNISSLTKAMRELHSNNLRFNLMRSNARKIISSNYEREYIWKEIRNLYSREIGNLK